MKLPQRGSASAGETVDNQQHAAHPWIAATLVFAGIGILALAAFWIKKCKSFLKMFNLYQSIGKKEGQEGESGVIGHDRFCRERPSRSCVRKKRKVRRRTRSVAELPPEDAGRKRSVFSCTRSRSSEGFRLGIFGVFQEFPEDLARLWRRATMFNLYQSIGKKEEQEREMSVIGHDRFCRERPSRSSVRRRKRIAKRTKSVTELPPVDAAQKRSAFFCTRSRSSEGSNLPTEAVASKSFSRRSSSPKHEYSALRLDSGEKSKHEQELRDGMYTICSQYLANNDRYELRTQLGNIGSRADKHWFVVQDKNLDAERLLTLVSLPLSCPIEPSELTKETVLSLFRSLQHPYIHPVLDVEFWDKGVALVSPLNPSGSLRDVIYSCAWHEDYHYKYHAKGEGLPLRQVQCLGRQILEALLFLRNRHFPPFHHLSSANVIIQNGVARLAALENPLFGLAPRPPGAPETLAFGHVLYEMTVGYELTSHPTAAHLEIELERAPKVAEVLGLIFQAGRLPSIEEILCCDLFRGVELRELRGANGARSFAIPADVLDLLDVVRYSAVPTPTIRSKEVRFVTGRRKLEDIVEEEAEECVDSTSVDLSHMR